jgi:2-polyprenyl-3-methyl-5-hydroxy-6-metoxy-1,4-benzoquinol methylase
VLDIGSGSYPIKQDVFGLDIQISKKPTIHGNALNLPIKTSSIDNITALEIIEHLHKPEQFTIVSEFKRVLKQDGTLIISIPNSTSFMRIPQQMIWFVREHTTQKEYHHNLHTHTHIGLISPNQLLHLLSTFGFRITVAKRLMLYDYYIIAKKS